MSRRYFDTAYLSKLHWPEEGSNQVLACASSVDEIACAVHGRAEFASVCLRKLREGVVTREQIVHVYAQFEADLEGGLLRFLPMTDAVVKRAEAIFRAAPPTAYLRAADALHLACAAENGFEEVYSSDRHLLAAAPLFRLRGVDVVAG
jgi:predicted nucleic acid-binding protein